MNRQLTIAIALAIAFAVPHAAAAMTTKHKSHEPLKVHSERKAINNSRPGSPGYTGSSPLGSAQKAVRREQKKAAKHPGGNA